MDGQTEMFAADFPEFQKVDKEVDMLLDAAFDAGDTNATQSRPALEPEEELSRVHKDIAGYGDDDDIEDEYPPGEIDQDSLGIIPDEEEPAMDRGQMGHHFESLFINEKGEYHRFFKRMMDEEGVSSIAQMSHDQKSEFFKKISAGWKKEKGKSVAESFKYLK